MTQKILNAPVYLAHSVYNAIVEHAREGKPEEICGIVRGRGFSGFQAIRARNVASEKIENYTVDPQTLLMQFEFEDEGDAMMGIYHSHPVSVAYPSATDAWSAYYPEAIYLICSLEFDDAPVIRAYRMTPHYVDFDLAPLQDTLEFYETRPGLFAYYQAEADELPDALAEVAADVPLPFYVVYYEDSQKDGQENGQVSESDQRIVALDEHPVVPVTATIVDGLVQNKLTFQAPVQADVQRVFNFLTQCDIAEYGEPDCDIEDIEHDWSQIDLEQDAWLALNEQDEIMGYVALLPWGQEIRYDVYVSPDWKEPDLGEALLAHCDIHAMSVAQRRELDIQETKIITFIAHLNDRDRKSVLEVGFAPGKYVSQMQIEMDTEPLPAQWPDGITVRTAITGQDDHALHELIQHAFHHPDRKPQSFEDWQKSMMFAELYKPELWFLAVADAGDNEEIIGACLSFQYSDIGWVRQLGVQEGWRRKGIGGALLRHAFGVYHQRGFGKVGLSVESDRPNSFQFYLDIGMKPLRQYDEYVKQLTISD